MEYTEEQLTAMLKKYTSFPINNEPKKNIKNSELYKSDEDLISNEEITITENKESISVPVIPLMKWMKKYELQEGTKTVKFNITGVSDEEYLLLKTPHPKGGEISPGVPKKELIMFKNPNLIPVLDLDINEILIYSSGIKMVHQFKNGFIKTYIGKSNLIATFTNMELIPYYITKIKSGSSLFYKENIFDIDEILKENADKELIKTLYGVISKDPNWDGMINNIDVCRYFINLQKTIRDNAHHIKIDNIMIGMITGRFPENSNLATHVQYQIQY